MVTSDRYDASNTDEGSFEPGSNNTVIRNKLGIRSLDKLSLVETEHLYLAREKFQEMFSVGHSFTAIDIKKMHEVWLGPIYSWAGQFRQVNMSKEGFTFAAAAHIPGLFEDYEKNFLSRLTPCNDTNINVVTKALASTHIEFILIHPFREGNGRIAREFAMLMASQAGLPPLNYSPIEGNNKKAYISAIHAGMGGDIEPMTNIFSRIIENTLSQDMYKSTQRQLMDSAENFKDVRWVKIDKNKMLENISDPQIIQKTEGTFNELEEMINKNNNLTLEEKTKICQFLGQKKAIGLVLNANVSADIKIGAAVCYSLKSDIGFKGMDENQIKRAKALAVSFDKTQDRSL